MKIIKILFFILLSISVSSLGADRYVDCDLATGSNDGTSWSNAWQHPDNITGLSSGDIVYFSGDADGTTCSMTQRFSDLPGYINGNSDASRVTYKIGQDSGHNGNVTFDLSGADFKWMFSAVSNITFSGDAGDGNRHFIITGGHMWNITGGTSINATYEYFSNTVGEGGSWSQYRATTSADNIEIAYCYMENATVTQGPTISLNWNTGATDYDNSSIHHCEFVTTHSTDATVGGFDHLSGGGNGISVYDNTFTSNLNNAYTGTDHQDIWQTNAGLKYCKFYNNKIVNTENYGLFMNELNDSCDHQHWRIYNNLLTITDSDLADDAIGGIIISNGTAPACDIQDIIVANNTIVDFDKSSAYSVVITYKATSSYSDIYFYNNLSVNSQPVKYPDNVDGSLVSVGTPLTGITVGDNLQINTIEAASYLTTYTEYDGLTNNYMPLGSASTIVDQAIDLSTYFTTDILGVTRTGTWDIGAYEFGGITLTGTVTSDFNEDDVVTGGRTIILTTTGTTWVATVGADNAITTALIGGIDSAQAEGTGWDAVVKADLDYTDVTRDSDTQVTILLPAEATYNITANETITVTVPTTATESGVEIVASPTFMVGVITATSSVRKIGYNLNGPKQGYNPLGRKILPH